MSYTTSDEKLTKEQSAIIKHVIKPGETLVANAFAGCGKTSTVLARIERKSAMILDENGEMLSLKPALYLAFNSVTQKEMERKTKHVSTVQSRTYHSLALRFTQWSLGSRVDIRGKPGNFAPYTGTARILKRYWKDASEQGFKDQPQRCHKTDRETERDFANAITAWNTMLTDAAGGWTHDATLKYMCMKHDEAEMWIETDYSEMIVDEAQDVQAVFAYFLQRLKRLPLFIVGDAYQSIYAFTGASNAIQKAIRWGKDEKKQVSVLNLTRSFRFGSKIASCATLLLHKAQLLEESIVVSGTPQLSGVVLSTKNINLLDLPRGCLCCVARTNATIFAVALDAIAKGRSVRFVGKSHELMREMNELLNTFKTQDQVEAQIKRLRKKAGSKGKNRGVEEDADDAHEAIDSMQLDDRERDELDKLCLIMSTGYAKLRAALEKMKVQSRKRKADPNEITLCTVHGAKGLEWDRVYMADDFPCIDRLIWGYKQSLLPLRKREYYADRFPLPGSCFCDGHNCRSKHAMRLLHDANLVVEKPSRTKLTLDQEEDEEEEEEEEEEEDSQAVEKIREELHIYYVALTRAKRLLYANGSLATVLRPLLGTQTEAAAQQVNDFFRPRVQNGVAGKEEEEEEGEEEEEEEEHKNKKTKKYF